ncbi:MAG: class I tRNA ligase family protein [Deltaproteobacteria bacterium]|nr:class I tRNA ligase family protein [Deltaproteobacteria bacterium]
MPLSIYNSASGKKEIFKPQNPPQVKLYVCGITTYDEAHLGHARAAVVFDVVFRVLKHLGYQVHYVRNYTDIDDKILKRAAENQEPWKALAERYVLAYAQVMDQLKVLKPTEEPRATDYIDSMQALIKILEEKNLAYAQGGDVFFAVRKFPTYGELAKKKLEDLEAGARVELREEKRDPLDFALWKKAKPGEPFWPSPGVKVGLVGILNVPL